MRIGSFPTEDQLQLCQTKTQGRPTSVPVSAPTSPLHPDSDPPDQDATPADEQHHTSCERGAADASAPEPSVAGLSLDEGDNDFDAEVAAINQGSPRAGESDCSGGADACLRGSPAPGSAQDIFRRVASMIRDAHGSVSGLVPCAEILTFVQALLEACTEGDNRQIDATHEATSLCVELGDGSGVMAPILRDMLCETFDGDEESLGKFEIAFAARRATRVEKEGASGGGGGGGDDASGGVGGAAVPATER